MPETHPSLDISAPTEMMKGFDTPGIESVAEEVEQAMKTMMQDAAALPVRSAAGLFPGGE